MIGLDPLAVVVTFAALLIAATVHEYAHALIADRLGDPTPRLHGRLTFNPLAHLDLIGTLMLILVGFGWAKPVPINPHNFSDWRRGQLLVAAAGPLANVTAMFLLGTLLKWHLVEAAPPLLLRLIVQTIWVNGILAVFNLIPVPPLDGSRILEGLLPGRYSFWLSRLQPYGILVLIVLVYTGFVGAFLRPLVRMLMALATGSG
ncbi:MAG: site-2 protease family protein [Armatimonadota bacterium]|nr:site-2 protease family protein [Armatimonadota bacterium]MDR5704130.1 site-2 protease family protein [Armatimonadota bacterium]MDR7435264.1 site-2 protease family protein [Armatimonadota bacterium]